MGCSLGLAGDAGTLLSANGPYQLPGAGGVWGRGGARCGQGAHCAPPPARGREPTLFRAGSVLLRPRHVLRSVAAKPPSPCAAYLSRSQIRRR